MNDDKQNIDKLFEEGLGHLSVEPSSGSWGKVAAGLDSLATGNRNKYWRWIIISTTAAAILAYIIFFRSCTVGASSESFIHKNRLVVFNNFTIIKRINTKAQTGFVINDKIKTKSANSLLGTDNKTNNHHKVNKRFSTTDKVNIQEAISNNSKESVEETPLIREQNSQKAGENVIAYVKQTTSDSKIGDVEETINPSTTQLNPSNSVEKQVDSLVDKTKVANPSPEINSPPPGPAIATGLELEFGLGLMNISNNLPSTIHYENLLLQNSPDNSISLTEGFVHLKYRVSNFYGKTGLRFSGFGENNTYLISTEMHDTSGGYQSWNMNRYWTYDTIGFYDDPNTPGQIYPILSPIYNIDTISTQWNSRDILYYDKSKYKERNRYRYIEIPLTIGFQKNFSRVGLFMDGGIGLGMMVYTQGSYVDAGNLLPMSYSNNPYKKFNINYLFNFGANYSLTNQWNVFLQGSYKSNLTSIYKPQYDQGIRYKSLGIQFGMSYIIK